MRNLISVAWLAWLAFGSPARAGDLTPYLQSPTESSLWITWWTSAGTESTVDYGGSSNALVEIATGHARNLGDGCLYHAVQLTNLAASTFYYYRARTAAAQSGIFRFRTQPALGSTNGHFRFLVMGDHQVLDPPRYQTLVARVKPKVESFYGVPIEEAINVVINDGDQVDKGTVDEYLKQHFVQSALISPNIPTLTTVGNHETYSDGGLAVYQSLFLYQDLAYHGIPSPRPVVYYSYQLANIVFVHLSTEHVEDQQTAWVSNIVQAAAADPRVDWMFSIGHRPYQAEQFVGDLSAYVRDTLMPIFAQTPKHVLTIAGHHHLYARGQTRDWPIYHLINGAAAWDQPWGLAPEQDFDDVQKTIANWAWQIVDIDLASREMVVDCYAEGQPRLGFVYTNKPLDHFHRKFGLPAPSQPSITNLITGPVTLPYTFGSSAYASSSPERMNSSQFQIAHTTNFWRPSVDVIRDVEDLFGDTGSPQYLPVDRNAGVNILNYTVPAKSLPDGGYFVRVRHRDANTLWSLWSEPKAFTVVHSPAPGAPALFLAKSVYSPGEPIVATYYGGPGNAKNWIEVYRQGQIPGSVAATARQPVQASGVANFSAVLATNQEYFAAWLGTGSCTEIAPRVRFYVGNAPRLKLSHTPFATEEAVCLQYIHAPGGKSDWIGIYPRGGNPAAALPTRRSGVSGASGTLHFDGLPKGYYFASYFANGGHFELSDRVGFSVGTNISRVWMTTELVPAGQPFEVHFADGPGTPKDWMGIYRAGGDSSLAPFLAYLYVGGRTAGTVTFSNQLAPGNYSATLFINDSFDAVSSRRLFKVRGPP